MNNLPIFLASDLHKYLVKSSESELIFVFPQGEGISINTKQIFDNFQDVKEIIDDYLPSGQQQITIKLWRLRLCDDRKIYQQF